MSKKDLVKNIIDGLIEDGKDFYEITQGTLAEMDELDGVSKTTIKRAKNEYKKEKIVVKRNYKETLIKRKIYKYLDRYPKTNLSELREALPEIPPAKVSEYHLFWTRKRERAKQNRTQKKVSVSPRKLKELVFNYLNDHEEVSCEQLLKAFPEANKSSVTSYFGHWKKKRSNHDKGKVGSLYHVIFKFLDGHEGASINELKDAFRDVPIKSLEVYLNLWQKKQQESQEQSSDAEQDTEVIVEKPKRRGRRPNSSKVVAQALVEDDVVEKPKKPLSKEQKMIEKLKKTVEKQKITLTALEVENSMLKDSIPSNLVEDFDSMTEQELKDVQEFVKTYIRGLNV